MWITPSTRATVGSRSAGTRLSPSSNIHGSTDGTLALPGEASCGERSGSTPSKCRKLGTWLTLAAHDLLSPGWFQGPSWPALESSRLRATEGDQTIDHLF